MTREELFEDFYNKKLRYYMSWPSFREMAEEYLAENPLPLAEGAEAFVKSLGLNVDYVKGIDLFPNPKYTVIDLMREFAAQSQPTAEGAEEILEKLEAYYDFKFHWVEKDRIIRAMHEFAALHAQRLAEKMVEERLRKELIAYDKWLYYKWVEGDVTTTEEHINEYLKSRESHE